MTFIFRNRTVFWDISKWNRGQKKWDGGSRIFVLYYIIKLMKYLMVQFFLEWFNGAISKHFNVEMIIFLICVINEF